MQLFFGTVCSLFIAFLDDLEKSKIRSQNLKHSFSKKKEVYKSLKLEHCVGSTGASVLH